jgi:hypothetical protein
LETPVIIGFVTLALLICANIASIAIWVGSIRSETKRHEKDISELKEEGKETLRILNNLCVKMGDLTAVNVAITTNADATRIVASSLAEHIRSGLPVCPNHEKIIEAITALRVKLGGIA